MISAACRTISPETYRHHLDEASLLQGECRSHYVPLSDDAKEFLAAAIARSRDCEEMFQYLIRYLAAVQGKRCKATRCQRQLLLRIAGLVNQYSDGSPIFISVNMFAQKEKMQALRLIRSLEEGGCLELISGHWESHKYEKGHNKCRSFKTAPLFRQVLDVIDASVQRYSTEGTFSGYQLQSYTKLNSAAASGVLDLSECNIFNEICPLGANYGAQGRRARRSGRRAPRHVEKLNRERRASSLARLWCLHTAEEIDAGGLVGKVAFNCHSTGIGPEWSDRDIERALQQKYGSDAFARLAAGNDAWLPSKYRTRARFNIGRDKNGNVTSIGCRPTNALCKTYNEAHKDKALATKEAPREDVVKALLGVYHHFDVKCSIYNVIHALNTGYFTPFHDYYGPAAEHFNLQRDEIKVPFMAVNFGMYAEQAARYAGKRALAHIRVKGDDGKKHALPLTYGELQSWMMSQGLVIQGRYTDIFWREAYIYELARKVLLEEHGVRSIRVYDSFYTDKGISRELWYHVLNKALAMYLGYV